MNPAIYMILGGLMGSCIITSFQKESPIVKQILIIGMVGYVAVVMFLVQKNLINPVISLLLPGLIIITNYVAQKIFLTVLNHKHSIGKMKGGE